MRQKQRRIECLIREDKRELRGAQQIYEKDRSITNLAGVERAKARLRDRQAAMRDFIKTSNDKCKPGTEVLHRNPRREWAGDIPKTGVPARTIHGNGQMKARGITNKQAADAIINPLKKFEIVIDDKGRPSQKHIGYDATVALNPETNEVITAYRTESKKRKKHGSDRGTLQAAR